MNKLVSIVTPVYNGEKYIERYIKSIIAQTYRPLELIIVNDGSKDDTENIIKSYEDIFKKENIEFHYIYQENAGQAVAVSKGIKMVTGEYFVWPDSDDFYNKDSIEKFVEFLEDNQQYSIVRSNADIVDEKNIDEAIGIFKPTKKDEDLFVDYIEVNSNVYFCPGVFMIRFKKYLELNPALYIYPSRSGQNWQILLPILYNNKCGHINESLYNYVVRSDSHSHANEKVDINKKLTIFSSQKELLINTIEHINMNDIEKAKYKKVIENKFVKQEYELFLEKGKIEDIKKAFIKMNEHKLINFRYYILYLCKTNKFFKFLYKIYKK